MGLEYVGLVNNDEYSRVQNKGLPYSNNIRVKLEFKSTVGGIYQEHVIFV